MNKLHDLVQIKISLKDCSVPVWRRVIVPVAYSLHDLHCVIQAVMGWTDSHLHGFFIGTTLYVDKKADWEDGIENEYEDERMVMLQTLLKKLPQQIMYTYDFGDSWDHEIRFERYFVSNEGVRYPACVNGNSACPPEDVGGVGGYDDFLDAVKHPKRKSSREILEWYGYEDEHEGVFDPAAFDIEAVNSELREFSKKTKNRTISK